MPLFVMEPTSQPTTDTLPTHTDILLAQVRKADQIVATRKEGVTTFFPSESVWKIRSVQLSDIVDIPDGHLVNALHLCIMKAGTILRAIAAHPGVCGLYLEALRRGLINGLPTQMDFTPYEIVDAIDWVRQKNQDLKKVAGKGHGDGLNEADRMLRYLTKAPTK